MKVEGVGSVCVCKHIETAEDKGLAQTIIDRRKGQSGSVPFSGIQFQLVTGCPEGAEDEGNSEVE